MNYPSSELVIDPVLLRKYDVGGPRYPSYPSADRFVEAFGEADLRRWLERRNIGGFSQPLSLGVHLPFCGSPRGTFNDLRKELALLGPLLGRERAIGQLHWGGGAPTILAREEMAGLMAAIDGCFGRTPEAECSIELDPRGAAEGMLAFLAGLGFNRVSLGVQDEASTRRAIEAARASCFRSVSLDLVYGQPEQTLDRFNRTLDEVIALDPDRITLSGNTDAASSELDLQILTLALGRLTRAGYLYLGMDHFARPGDELAVAQRQGRLQRSFQGYSTRPEADLLGLGLSAIGRIGPTCYQNHKRLEDYRAALEAGRLPVARGLELSPDDLARRAVIQALACQFRVAIESIELAYLVDFKVHFAKELAQLKRFADEGLVELSPEWIVVTPKGRLLVRVICRAFDRHLRERQAQAAYSRVI